MEATETNENKEATFLQGGLSPTIKLERARTELLDLSARNRLLNIPRNSKNTRTIEVVDEKSSEVFRVLVKDGRAFTFLAGRASENELALKEEQQGEQDEEINELAQPEDESMDERGVFNRHTDTKLQTKLTSKGLQKRLLDLYFDARTLEEEQGVNILFLTLGTLKWIDPTNAKNVRYAPLILVPVSLERGNAAEQFKLKWRQEEFASNLSLEAFLERVHKLKLPSFEVTDDFNVMDYLVAVADAISSKENWSVNADDIVLGFFSFSKFLMYRDLDPEMWPIEGGLTAQPLIDGLLSTGFKNTEQAIPEDAILDNYIPAADLLHIVDCDGSQTLAVHDVRAGRNLVIQGPPGTGKSQTIANIIASAVADGKTVLFVAEKMAALEVVKRRLDQAGVGDTCLELHSNKANKRILLEELRRTAELGSPRGDFPNSINSRLEIVRRELNDHAARMHIKHGASGLTPYHIIGHLSRLRQDQFQPVDLTLKNPESWSADERDLRQKLVSELAQRITEIGTPTAHPWRGVGLTAISPLDVERLTKRISELQLQIKEVFNEYVALASTMRFELPVLLTDIEKLTNLAERIIAAPKLSGAALLATEWETDRDAISKLVDLGFDFANLVRKLDGRIHPLAWTTDTSEINSLFDILPADFGNEAFERATKLHRLLPTFLSEANQLKAHLGFSGDLDTIVAIKKTVLTGERIAAAPDVSAEIFAATIWDQGIERASELVDAVHLWEHVRNKSADKVSDSAWATDFSSARQTLAVHGSSVFRFIKSDWRSANTLVRAALKNPDITLTDKLGILDDIAKGRKALETIQANDEFGRTAFGVDWRAERSNSAPMRALVEWMRSLRGLGAEPRLIASRLPNRSLIADRVIRLQNLLEEIHPLLLGVWTDCADTYDKAFPGALSIDDAYLPLIVERARRLQEVHRICIEILPSLPSSLEEKRDIFRLLKPAQELAAKITERRELGTKAFDTQWMGTESDWSALDNAIKWMSLNSEIKSVVAHNSDRSLPLAMANNARSSQEKFVDELDALFRFLNTNSENLFKIESRHLPFDIIERRFSLWIENAEQLSKWVSYQERADKASAIGVGSIVERLGNGTLIPTEAAKAFDMAYYEAIFIDIAKTDPSFTRFDGQLHTRHVSEFVELDKQRIAASSLEVVRAHHRRIPQAGGAVGPLGILRGEMARRRGHMPIRQLMLKAAPAIQAIKPVMMMSPLSVAQFLTPGHLTFDLLVMDEASQIQPVDALGAIARSRQIVVVGDERQLPPTKFFSKMTGDQDEDEDGDGAQVSDIESILGLFRARGLPQRMLRWHYRSRHQSLIAVSNSQFYENKLFIVPSPYTQEAGMGLQFQHIPDGIFDSGNTGTNVVEAKRVAEAIIRHAKTHPERSLGVATFSVKQRRAIQDHLELLRRANPETEPFFSAHPSEPFFVKNLENVQGDERDVIFISVGYGRNPQGYMAMRFGPLSADGGERRLNVLISRAKLRCEVFSSITDEDIDLERGKGKGVFAFKLFLHFARTGRLHMNQVSNRDFDSVFELQVASALQGKGYQVHPQVGIAGFFIDLAVGDPEHPGRYILGIECDGVSYHESRSARDRDRLRQAVLEDHGWIIHRIWSSDWFQRPHDELQRLIAAIDSAKSELQTRQEIASQRSRAVPIEVITIERADTVEIGLANLDAPKDEQDLYVEATLSPPVDSYELHETPIGILAELIEKIVAVEGPIHADEVIVRLRSAWGLKRAGARIQSTIERGIEFLHRTQRIVVSENFLSIPEQLVVVRNRSDVQSETLRKPEMLPREEISIAILNTVKENFGGSSDEIVQAVSRLFGFKATSSQLKDVIKTVLEALISKGSLTDQGGILVVKK